MLLEWMKRQVSRKSPGKLDSVQVMRAMAALAVCFSHILHEISLHMQPGKAFEIFRVVPWEMGVDLFFIISGFIMMYTSRNKFGNAGAPREFIIRRLLRIVPPYWFFTTLMVIATLTMASHLDTAIFTPGHALLSYFFIPHLDPLNAHKINPILGVGWTLIYEMFFYCAFSVALFWKPQVGLSALLVFFGALFAAASQGLFSPALNILWSNSIMFCFLLGILVYLMLDKKESIPLSHAVLLSAFGLTSILAAHIFGLETLRIFRTGMPALIIFVLLYRLPMRFLPGLGLMVLVGDASYTLYLSHPFTLEVAKLILNRVPYLQLWPTVYIVVYALASALATTATAVVFYLACEKPVASYLQRKIVKRQV